MSTSGVRVNRGHDGGPWGTNPQQGARYLLMFQALLGAPIQGLGPRESLNPRERKEGRLKASLGKNHRASAQEGQSNGQGVLCMKRTWTRAGEEAGTQPGSASVLPWDTAKTKLD